MWPITRQRAYAVARSWWLDSDGRVDWARLPLETVFEGEQLGRWVQAQRAGSPDLEADQRDLLAAIGIEEDPELAAAKAAAEARPTVSRTDRFAQGLAALAAFVERGERHPRVPRPHKEPVEAVEAGPGRGGAGGGVALRAGHLAQQPESPPRETQPGTARPARRTWRGMGVAGGGGIPGTLT
ncbi:helicase associated domain-containing protein [Kitasatospora sp. NPDC059973]|uniref:helicase associated domain-containing protein n=1 Tax=Kitasatospora sp. NPDC059973 TaxID=3347020 RepID=UPI0036987DD1